MPELRFVYDERPKSDDAVRSHPADDFEASEMVEPDAPRQAQLRHDTLCPQVNQQLLKIDKPLRIKQLFEWTRVTLFVFHGPDFPPALD